MKRKMVEKNPIIIIARNYYNIMSLGSFVAWLIFLIMSMSMYLCLPDVFDLTKLSDSSQTIFGFLGITLTLLSLRAYENNDLARLFMGDENHKLYYGYIVEYIFADFLWLLTGITIILDEVVCAPDSIVSILSILRYTLLTLNVFLIFDIVIKNINRLSNKVVKISEEKKDSGKKTL